MALDIIGTHGDEDLATVYVASLGEDRIGRRRVVEFVESLQPPHPREDKWVLIVSSLLGCPVDCAMCDAGGDYCGRLESGEILAQVDAMVRSRYPDGRVPARKFKVQFARMGEPALNPAVLEVLRELPGRYYAPGLMPCVSTVAPAASAGFFSELTRIKDEHYGGGRFQLQFSVHSTDPASRDRLMPLKKWGLGEIAAFGERWYRDGDRKVSLNFAAMEGHPIDTSEVARIFDPARFVIKLTPMNPTVSAHSHSLVSVIDGRHPETGRHLVDRFEDAGFEVILSIGEMAENTIGSNCGQFVRAMNGGY
jgi:23S rRNA (adenine2503-C2)-methyltransferase